MHLRTVPLAAACTLALLLASSARAAGPCHADVQKLCADAAAPGGAVVACLRAHEAELSQPCKDHLAAVKKRVGPLVATCRYDITLFCSDVAPGGGRIARCLADAMDRLSPECKDAVAKVKAKAP